MNNYMFFSILMCAAAAMAVFSGMNKMLKQHFDTDIAENSYQSEAVIETQSEKTQRIKEKNERLMDDMRSKMERLKRN